MQFIMKIRYKTHNGLLDPTNGCVKFYDTIYNTINDAVKLEANLNRDSIDEKLPSPFLLRTKSQPVIDHTES